MSAITQYTGLAWGFLGLLDEGESLEIADVHDHVNENNGLVLLLGYCLEGVQRAQRAAS